MRGGWPARSSSWTTRRPSVRPSSKRSSSRAIGRSPPPTGARRSSQFRAEQPDLVLLDLMLPELSGVEVCRILRAESAVPIIMLTARDAEVDKVVGPRARRGRLRHQAVLAARAHGADPGDLPARRPGRGRGDRRPSRRRPSGARPGAGGPRRPPAAARRRGRARQAEGVRAARVPPPPPGPGVHPRPAPGARLGLRLRGRDADRRRPRPLAPRRSWRRTRRRRGSSRPCAAWATSCAGPDGAAATCDMRA